MRTLLSTEQNNSVSSSIYPRYSTTKTSYPLSSSSSLSDSSYRRISSTSSSSRQPQQQYTETEQQHKHYMYDERSGAVGVRLPIERQYDLSPVSKFREEQKGYIYKSKLSSGAAANNNSKQTTYKSSMLSAADLLSETTSRNGYKSNKNFENNKTAANLQYVENPTQHF